MLGAPTAGALLAPLAARAAPAAPGRRPRGHPLPCSSAPPPQPLRRPPGVARCCAARSPPLPRRRWAAAQQPPAAAAAARCVSQRRSLHGAPESPLRLSPEAREYLEIASQEAVDLEALISGGTADEAIYDRQRYLGSIWDTCIGYAAAMRERKELQQMAAGADQELADLAKEDLAACEERIQELVAEFLAEVRPEEDIDNCDVFLETQGGAGGTEADLFADELFEAYKGYARRLGWRFTVLAESSDGGASADEAISDSAQERVNLAKVSGEGVMGVLKWEAGVHRVQRIPVTDASGRIHTSTAGVKVVPAFSTERLKAAKLDIPTDDLRIWAARASGPGGQSVNMGMGRACIIHKPTGIYVTSKQERGFHQNKDICMEVLRGKLWEIQQDRLSREMGEMRRSAAFSLERHNRVRTYNWPRREVIDHRLGREHALPLDQILEGDLSEVTELLVEKDYRERAGAHFQQQAAELRARRNGAAQAAGEPQPAAAAARGR